MTRADAPTRERKSFPVIELKALDGADEPGTFEALVSVFGNVDPSGDRVVKGAFARSLKERGLPPIVWSHDWQTPPIGATLAALERDEGLYIKGRLRIGGDAPSPTALDVWGAMRDTGGDGQPALREFSFGYRTVKSRIVDDADEPNAYEGQVRELLDVDIFEAGPTLVGLNPETELIAVKGILHAAAADGALTPEAVRSLLGMNPGEPQDKKLVIARAVLAPEVEQLLERTRAMPPPITL